MTTVLVMVLLIVALIAALIYIPRVLMRRAIRSVVSLFRERGATGPTSATTLEELGLVRGGPLDRMFRPRDYRPQALRLLAEGKIIRTTEEGRVYLSEEELEHSPVKRFARIK